MAGNDAKQAETTGEGWGWPESASKAHYFRESRSLCGRWMFFGALDPKDSPSPDDCLTCTKKLGRKPFDAGSIK